MHPTTASLSDPDLPAVAALLGSDQPAPLAALAELTGGTLRSAVPTTITWWPGSSIVVRYRAEFDGGSIENPADVIAATGRIPDGAVVVEGPDGEHVGVWALPHDPALPGLVHALHPTSAASLLRSLGGRSAEVSTSLKAYRPGRRAVVAVSGAADGLYLKLVRPSKVEALHERHRNLPQELPVPVSLGVDPELGVLALQTMPGHTLRNVFEMPAMALPSPASVVGLSRSLPAPTTEVVAPSAIDRAPRLARLLSAALPSASSAVDEIIGLVGTDAVSERVPVHGDYYEAQLLVDNGEIVGLLDVDTYGWGRPGDDAATMLGHLAVWGSMSSQSDRVRTYAGHLLRLWDATLDPADLRRRVAAVILGLATGPFRVQRADWPEETMRRLAMARRWTESAARVA